MTDVQGESPTESMNDPSDPRAVASRYAEGQEEAHPKRIGPYRILETLGEGGMGIVYLAEQNRPFHRRVALKIIKLGMDSKQVMARFETEREALALMNHPNVAKVFDAGATEQGRPFFVMEYVPGIPISDYCDKHRLNTEERLRLFMDVCHAVQHAHQKGIIHRDIKPSNVLVSVDSANPPQSPLRKGGGSSASHVGHGGLQGVSVKVIDFGVAKATQKKLTEQTLFTEQGQLIGTPGYMSPEQAEMTALDIDTRTDIYSLGVVLYELLVGARPFDDEVLRKAGLAEIQRIIRETDPPKPSTRLSSLGDTSTQIAQKRRTELRTLGRILRGDLDWIVMKCLEKDRIRRYATANGLALEIERYLNNEPVLAGPPSTTYRLRKFLRRNKGPVAAVAAVVVVLIAGLAGTTYGLAQAVRAREAEAKQRRWAEQSERKALAARDEAEAVTQFLTDTLGAVDPRKAKGADLSVLEVLDEATKRVGVGLSSHPAVEAALRHTLGTTYLHLDQYKRAQEQLEIAVRLRRDPRVADELKLADSLRGLGFLAEIVDDNFERSRALHNQVLAIRERRLGKDHPLTVEALTDLVELERHAGNKPGVLQLTAEVIRRVTGSTVSDEVLIADLERKLDHVSKVWKQGRIDEALAYVHSEMQPYVEGGLPVQTLVGILIDLSDDKRSTGDYGGAEPLLLEAVRIAREAGDSMHIAIALKELARLRTLRGEYGHAAESLSEVLEVEEGIYGPEHARTLGSMGFMGRLLRMKGSLAQAEVYFREGLKRSRTILGEENDQTVRWMVGLANVLQEQRRFAEAEELCWRTLEIRRRVLGEEHEAVNRAIQDLAELLHEAGKLPESQSLFREAIERYRGRADSDDASPVDLVRYAYLLLDCDTEELRDPQAALPIAERAVEATARRNVGMLGTLALAYYMTHQTKHAVDTQREALAILPHNATPFRVAMEARLGEYLTADGDFADAEPLLLNAYQAFTERDYVRPQDLKKSLDRIVTLYDSWDAAEPGKGYAEKAAEWREKLEELNASGTKYQEAEPSVGGNESMTPEDTKEEDSGRT